MGLTRCVTGNGDQCAAFGEGGRIEGQGRGFGGRARLDMQDIEVMEGDIGIRWEVIPAGLGLGETAPGDSAIGWQGRSQQPEGIM